MDKTENWFLNFPYFALSKPTTSSIFTILRAFYCSQKLLLHAEPFRSKSTTYTQRTKQNSGSRGFVSSVRLQELIPSYRRVRSIWWRFQAGNSTKISLFHLFGVNKTWKWIKIWLFLTQANACDKTKYTTNIV